MRAVIDRGMTKHLSNITGTILTRYFFYDAEDVDFFERCFAQVINGEHANLQLFSSYEFKCFLWGNKDAQQKFTANFLGFFLIQTLSDFLFFDEMELIHFENILLKFLKEVEPNEHGKEYARKNNRNPFKAL